MFAGDEAQGGAAPRIHPQIDVRAAGDLLTRAGFALPVADVDRINIRHSGLTSLLSDLRAMAGTNMLAAQHRAPLTRRGYAAALAEFASAADPDGKTVEIFDILHLSGWAPSPDQPRAARRGQRDGVAGGRAQAQAAGLTHSQISASRSPISGMSAGGMGNPNIWFGRTHFSAAASSGSGLPRHLRQI
jgi:hypothetical protein